MSTGCLKKFFFVGIFKQFETYINFGMLHFITYRLTLRSQCAHSLMLEHTVDNVIGILMAGHETSSVLFTFMIRYLANRPDALDKITERLCAVCPIWNAGNFHDSRGIVLLPVQFLRNFYSCIPLDFFLCGKNNSCRVLVINLQSKMRLEGAKDKRML